MVGPPRSLFLFPDAVNQSPDIQHLNLSSPAMDPETSPSTPHAMVNFTLLTPSTASVLTPRLGTLAFAGRKPISTPNFVPLTSRGAVLHVSHDVMREQTAIGSLYFGLEDCMFY
jgi:hypothetical protein